MTFDTIDATAFTMPVSSDAVSAGPKPDARRQGIPLTMPSCQEYYWRFSWQEGERESLSQLNAGSAVRFDSDDPQDIARWLDDGPDAG